MTRKILLGVVALVLVSTPLSAQFATGKRGSFPGCPTCGVVSAIDSPQATSPSPIVPEGQLYLAGWGFECYAGGLVDRVDVRYRNDDGDLVTAHTLLIAGLPRMDVQRAFSGSCVPPWDSGFHVYFLTPLPHGQREIYINVWSGDAYYEVHRRDVFIR